MHVVPDTQAPLPVQPVPPHWPYLAMAPPAEADVVVARVEVVKVVFGEDVVFSVEEVVVALVVEVLIFEVDVVPLLPVVILKMA